MRVGFVHHILRFSQAEVCGPIHVLVQGSRNDLFPVCFPCPAHWYPPQ